MHHGVSFAYQYVLGPPLVGGAFLDSFEERHSLLLRLGSDEVESAIGQDQLAGLIDAEDVVRLEPIEACDLDSIL